jgi:glycosyltransferase involved in cell wall biosynthesis
MKLAVLTPTLKISAIGRVASLVARALVAHGHDVVTISSQSEELLEHEAHDFPSPPIAWNDHAQVNDVLQSQADAVVYHVGDNYSYHKGCIEWLPRSRGVVCLHDFFLGNLFLGWREGNVPESSAILTGWYGSAAAKAFAGFGNIDDFIEGTRETSPLTEWICSMASGVVTHSSWGVDRVLKSCAGPVKVVPLAYDAESFDAAAPDLDKEKFNLLTVGNVNFNKRVESVIASIGRSTILRDHMTYRLVGAVRPEIREKLSGLASEHGVSLLISGQTDDTELRKAMLEADVISCLRSPVLEAASASAIEAMLYGKPTVVTNSGFYQEIPDNCTMKIDPADEIASLQYALERLFKEENLRASVGSFAQKWAAKTFSSDNYAARLVETSELANAAEPLISMANTFSAIVRGWGGSEKIMSLEETLSPLKVF